MDVYSGAYVMCMAASVATVVYMVGAVRLRVMGLSGILGSVAFTLIALGFFMVAISVEEGNHLINRAAVVWPIRWSFWLGGLFWLAHLMAVVRETLWAVRERGS